MPTPRPTSFTMIAIALVWLALGGFGFAVFAPAVPANEFSKLGIHMPTMAAIGLAFGVTALLLAFGLWRTAAWTPHAVLLWGASVYASALAMPIMTHEAISPWWLWVLFLVMPAIPVFALHRHVRKTIAHGEHAY